MIRLGFIGVGFVAQQCHLPAFDSVLGCQIAAIADLQIDLAEKVGRRYEVPKIHSNHEKILEDPNIDAVVITVPRALTADLCIQALRYGKKVFVEKPLALNIQSGLEIVKLAEKNNLLLQVGYMRRFDAAVLEVFEKINQHKSMGINPTLVRAYCYAGDSYASPFGSFKSEEKVERPITGIEHFPLWLPIEWHVAYENYLNIFTHTLDLLNYILQDDLTLRDSVLDKKGQGVTLLKSRGGIPIELSTARSSLNQWMEGLSFVFPDQIIDLQLGPAFLKNVPGTVSIRRGADQDIVTINRPKWSWAFKNQAEYFIEQCKKWPYSASDRVQAVDHIEMVGSIFQQFRIER